MNPARYAQRFAVRTHPDYRRNRTLALRLRDLAVDPNEHVANLAREALRNGPRILPMLADVLDEANHPAAEAVNWRAVPRGIAIDRAVRAAANRMARSGQYLDYPAGYDHIISRAGNAHPAVIPHWNPDEYQFHNQSLLVHQSLHREAMRHIPDISVEEFNESLLRHKEEDFERAGHMPAAWRVGTRRVAREVDRHQTTADFQTGQKAKRYLDTKRIYGRQYRPVRYATFPGQSTPTVTVQVPVPTPLTTRPKARQPVPKPTQQPQQSVPMQPQEPDEPEFQRAPFMIPKALIFPHAMPPQQPQRMGRRQSVYSGPVRYAAGKHGTPQWNPPPHPDADPNYMVRRDQSPLWKYHQGVIGYGGGQPMWGEKPSAYHTIHMLQGGGWHNDATYPPPEGMISHREARERWGGVDMKPGSQPSPDQLLTFRGVPAPGVRAAFAPILWDTMPGGLRFQHPANYPRYRALFDFHGGGRRPWYNAVFPLQELMQHADHNDPYRLLAAAVHTGNRHAIPMLVDWLKRRDNPAGWWPGWTTLHKAMTDRVGDLPPQEVIRRIGDVATATRDHSRSAAEHAHLAVGALQRAESGDFTGLAALADHMDENGLEPYAQLVRAELMNVMPGLRGTPKGRRRFSRSKKMARNIEPHPLFARDGVNPHLSHLLTSIAAQEDRYPQAADVATYILARGDTSLFPTLGRALAAEQHPDAKTIRWHRAERAVKIDNAMLDAHVTDNVHRFGQTVSRFYALTPFRQRTMLDLPETFSHVDARLRTEAQRAVPDVTAAELVAATARLRRRADLLHQDFSATQWAEHNAERGFQNPGSAALEQSPVALPTEIRTSRPRDPRRMRRNHR